MWVQDHNKVRYRTKEAMCKAYGITVEQLRRDLDAGCSIKYSLTRDHSKKRPRPVIKENKDKETKTKAVSTDKTRKVTDHLGNIFRTKGEMCSFYNITNGLYNKRISDGMTQAEALTTATRHGRYRTLITDFKGIQHESMYEMYKYYGVTKPEVDEKLKQGYTLAEILQNVDKPDLTTIRYIDHNGIEYNSLEEMCNSYQISLDTYYKRKAQGLSLKESLTGAVGTGKPRIEIVDHKGNAWHSVREMCKAYGVDPTTFVHRRERGWNLEKSLLGKDYKDITDHLGNRFSSMDEMCKFYGIVFSTYKRRINRGYTKEEALTAKWAPGWKPRYKLSNGEEYKTITELCYSRNINVQTYHSRRAKNYSIDVCAGLKPIPDAVLNKLLNSGLGYSAEHNKYTTLEEIRAKCDIYDVYLVTSNPRATSKANSYRIIEKTSIHIFEDVIEKITKIASLYHNFIIITKNKTENL